MFPRVSWEVLDSLRSQHELGSSTLSFLTTNQPCALLSPDKRPYRKGTRLWPVGRWQVEVWAGGHSH